MSREDAKQMLNNGADLIQLITGMIYKGPGDDAEGRVKETLLFSRTAKTKLAGPQRTVEQQLPAGGHFWEQEIADIAARMVAGWHRMQLTTEQMERRLQQGQWPCAMEYWQARQAKPGVYRKLVEQTQDYITRLREANFSLAGGIDPFAQCAFPSDSAQLRQFFRRVARSPSRQML